MSSYRSLRLNRGRGISAAAHARNAERAAAREAKAAQHVVKTIEQVRRNVTSKLNRAVANAVAEAKRLRRHGAPPGYAVRAAAHKAAEAVRKAGMGCPCAGPCDC